MAGAAGRMGGGLPPRLILKGLHRLATPHPTRLRRATLSSLRWRGGAPSPYRNSMPSRSPAFAAANGAAKLSVVKRQARIESDQ